MEGLEKGVFACYLPWVFLTGFDFDCFLEGMFLGRLFVKGMLFFKV